MTKFKLFIYSLCFLNTVFCFAELTPDGNEIICQKNLQPAHWNSPTQLDNNTNQIERQLDKATPGDTLVMKTSLYDNSYTIIRSKDVHSDKSLGALRAKGNFIAEITFSLSPLKNGGNDLTIGHAKTEEEFQKRGIYKLLFAQILSTEILDIRQISTMLADTNLEAFNKYYRKIPLKDRILSPKLSFMLALVHTPAYQIRMNFGFTKVIQYKRSKISVEFVAVREEITKTQ